MSRHKRGLDHHSSLNEEILSLVANLKAGRNSGIDTNNNIEEYSEEVTEKDEVAEEVEVEEEGFLSRAKRSLGNFEILNKFIEKWGGAEFGCHQVSCQEQREAWAILKSSTNLLRNGVERSLVVIRFPVKSKEKPGQF